MKTVASAQINPGQTLTQDVQLALVGFALLFVSAQITIPLQPIPITLQSMAVMIIGLTYRTRPALSAIALYLFAGSVGAPVFGEWSGGFAKLAGPSGGYFMGFFAAALLMTTWRKVIPSNSFAIMLLNCLLGTSVIFAFGVGWLSHYVGATQAIALGLMPFILPGLVKALLLCGALRYLRKI